MNSSSVLKLNMNQQHVKITENLYIKVEFSYINYSISVRNLGLILDNTLGMEKQVNPICYVGSAMIK